MWPRSVLEPLAVCSLSSESYDGWWKSWIVMRASFCERMRLILFVPLPNNCTPLFTRYRPRTTITSSAIEVWDTEVFSLGRCCNQPAKVYRPLNPPLVTCNDKKRSTVHFNRLSSWAFIVHMLRKGNRFQAWNILQTWIIYFLLNRPAQFLEDGPFRAQLVLQKFTPYCSHYHK